MLWGPLSENRGCDSPGGPGLLSPDMHWEGSELLARSVGWLPVSCSGSSSSMQAWTSCGQGQWAWPGDTCRAAEDWLLEEEVLLSEMVECGLLKGVGWLQAGTAVEVWALDSVPFMLYSAARSLGAAPLGLMSRIGVLPSPTGTISCILSSLFLRTCRHRIFPITSVHMVLTSGELAWRM